MIVEQISVFIENKEGRLSEIASVLAENEIDISALSLADTDEYGVLRMIVSDPYKAKEVLNEHGVIGKVTDVSDTEREQLIEQFDNWEAYSQLGGMLISEGRVVGISVGEIVGDTLIIHTEKADTSFDGAYPMLVNCFAREFAADDKCLYINREEDCGIEGLRISKRSYHPIEIIKKYAVIIKELS